MSRKFINEQNEKRMFKVSLKKVTINKSNDDDYPPILTTTTTLGV